MPPAQTTEADNLFDIWRRIPPEEKLHLMAKAHAQGLGACFILFLVTGSIAVGLKLPWVIWSTFCAVPFVFQFASARAWRDLRPRTILEYLAARSAVRRYAFGVHSKDLTIALLFKGTLREEFSAEQVEEALEASLADSREVAVWVGLFPDAVVMLSERPGGGKLEFAHLIDDRLKVEAIGYTDGDSRDRAVALAFPTRTGGEKRFTLRSSYPAALLVFERRVKSFFSAQKLQIERESKAYRDMFASASDDDGEF